MGEVKLLCDCRQEKINMKILPVGDIRLIRNVKVGDEDRTETLIIERWFFKDYCEIIGSVIKLGIGEYDLTGGTLLIGGKKFTDWSKIDTDEVEYSISGTEKLVNAKTEETPLLTTPFTPAMYNKIPVVKLAKQGIHGIGSMIRNVMHPEVDESEKQILKVKLEKAYRGQINPKTKKRYRQREIMQMVRDIMRKRRMARKEAKQKYAH